MQEWLDRKAELLPYKIVKIIIQHHEGYFTGTWIPYNPINYGDGMQPQKGYLGTFYADSTGYGYNVWNQNNYEFRYYKLI